MTKNEIINDINFKQKCGKYGLYWENCEMFDDVILLYTPIQDLYVLLDKNYNTIGVETIKPIERLEELTKRHYYTYANLKDTVPFGDTFGYPFEDYTLKQIVDLANRIQIIESNHGHSLSTKINGVWVDREKSQENEVYLQLLSYIKFLGEEIQNYFLINYQMQIMSFEMPDIYSYVRNLISRLNQCVDFHINNNRRPLPSYILSSLGQNYREFKMDGMLYDIADLIMKDKGYKVKSGIPDEIEKVNNQEIDLSSAANDLLKLLNISDEELRKIEKENRDKLLEQRLDNFRSWLDDDDDDIEEECVFAVPCNRPFVVAPEKAKEFLNSKPDPELREQMERNAKQFEKQLKRTKE